MRLVFSCLHFFIFAALSCGGGEYTESAVFYTLPGPGCDLIPELSHEKILKLSENCQEKREIFFGSDDNIATQTLCRNAVEGTIEALSRLDGAVLNRNDKAITIRFDKIWFFGKTRSYEIFVRYGEGTQQVTSLLLIVNEEDEHSIFRPWTIEGKEGTFRMNQIDVVATSHVAITSGVKERLDELCRDFSPGGLAWTLANLESRSLMCPKGERWGFGPNTND